MQSTPVVFDFQAWAARYPEFAQVGQLTAQQYFNEAQLYVDNTPCSIIPNCTPAFQRATFLNMVTAHIASLNFPVDGQPANPLVGRISNATQGSVSVQAQFDVPAGSAQWFAQTKYGAAFWQASSAYRTMHYVPGSPSIPNPYGFNRFIYRG
jgi:hypothetical protein